MSEMVESVLAQIPGWENATHSEVTGGQTNHTFLVEADGRRAVLKIDQTPRGAPYNSRQSEAQIQTRAAEKDLASPVLFANDTAYMTEYLEGVVWSSSCLDEDENLDNLATALRKLHALPLTGRTFDAIGAAREYARDIDQSEAQRVSDCLRKIDAGPQPHNLCCCHNDLVVENIISTPDVRFLDWEYACDNDPFFDLATIVAHHKLSPEQSDYLLDAYFDGDGKQWREQLARQVKIYAALFWLWEASRP